MKPKNQSQAMNYMKINRKKRCLDQEGFPGLGVNGSCKVELNFRSEKQFIPL